jgi:DNA-binding IclR family transcriptional regulator
VLLAHLDPAGRRVLLRAAGLDRFTSRTITTRRALEAQLVDVLADGYATTFQEYEDGLNAVAAPVRDHTGEVVAAVSVSGPAYRLDEPRVAEIASQLRRGANRISDRMGHLG